MMTWILMDMFFSSEKKPTFLGGLNGMICGLVGITPAAGYVNGLGAIMIGLVCSAVVWVAWYTLPKYVWPFNKVDDALGVIYTHGIAGLLGGLLVGCLADPNMIEYIGLGKTGSIYGTGAFYGHPHQLLVQFLAALTIIIWDGAVTFVIWMFIKYVLRIKLRLTDEELEVGDVAIHGEEAYPARGDLHHQAQRHRRGGSLADDGGAEPGRRRRVIPELTLRCGRSESGPRPRDRPGSGGAALGMSGGGDWLPLLLFSQHRAPQRRRDTMEHCETRHHDHHPGHRRRRPDRRRAPARARGTRPRAVVTAGAASRPTGPRHRDGARLHPVLAAPDGVVDRAALQPRRRAW